MFSFSDLSWVSLSLAARSRLSGVPGSDATEQGRAAEFDAEWVDEITISGTGQHVAVLIGDMDGVYVADFTARQFDPGLPFPLVAGVQEWKKIIQEAAGGDWSLEDED